MKMSPAMQKAAAAYQRAAGLHRAKKVDEAIAAYQEFLKLADAASVAPPAKAMAYQNLAGLYLFKGDVKAQENALRQAIKLDPGNTLGMAQLAVLLAERNQEGAPKQAGRAKLLAEAQQLATRALQKKPPTVIAAPAHFALGLVAMARNDTTAAEKSFATAAKLAPENPQAHFNLALALGRNKKWQQAEEEALKAKALNPQVLPVYLYIGAVRQELKDFPGALQHMRPR
jgi:tetratricopeptide (TPR) repeat protein